MPPKPKPEEIDILQMELDQKLPHWLDWPQRYPDKADAIRKKNRDKYLAEQKQKKRTKAFLAVKAQAQATLDRTRDFDPGQPRDEHGRWTDTGAGDGDGGATTASGFSPGIKAHNDTDATKKIKEGWFAVSPFKPDDITGAMAAAPAAQKELGDVGEALAKKLGVEFKNPGVKKNVERIKQKADIRGGVHRVTDLARATFIINSPEQADIIAAELAKHFEVAAEDWKVTPVNYADKALQLRFKNGTIGEVQVMDQAMATAKSPGGGKGHDLYTELRKLDPVKDKERYQAIEEQMRTLYGGVIMGYSPSWRAALRRP